ncbi:hypothetical protein BDQ12DRAFT_615945 [Crucibulum laeve]|uniref:Uncharacterized protein n=1 Tax=Crucibulum laeve TaxID=68775 RepID=A0A5C3LKI1_9AGAR|nr:hypothetical protein BDQ12DRAFT_615945 [Crucibulum laeve]
MVLSRKDDRDAQPFWYARVIGVFHAKVTTTHHSAHSKDIERMHFLFVRWFGSEPSYRFGFHQAQLPKIGFVEYKEDFDNYPFSFLDPTQVLRGCHLIPAFQFGLTDTLLPHECSVAQQLDTSRTEDWLNYYVNVFVDRDMVMLHYGHGGIGHQSRSRRCENAIMTAGSESQRESDESELDADANKVDDNNKESGSDDELPGLWDDSEEEESEEDDDDDDDKLADGGDDDGFYASD